MSNGSPTAYLLWAILSSSYLVFLLLHLWYYDRFACLRWNAGRQPGAFKRVMTYTFLATVPLLMFFSVTITVLKFREGFLITSDGTPMPRPFSMWSSESRNWVLPLHFVLSIAWSLEHVTHLEELTFWVFLLTQGPGKREWFDSWEYHVWTFGSITTVAGMPTTVVVTRYNLDTCLPYIFLVGSVAGTTTTICFFYVLARFPWLIAHVKKEGAESDVVVRLATFYQLNLVRVVFRFLFTIPFMVLGIDALHKGKHPIIDNSFASDFLIMMGSIGCTVSSAITVLVFFPRSFTSETGYKEVKPRSTSPMHPRGFTPGPEFAMQEYRGRQRHRSGNYAGAVDGRYEDAREDGRRHRHHKHTNHDPDYNDPHHQYQRSFHNQTPESHIKSYTGTHTPTSMHPDFDTDMEEFENDLFYPGREDGIARTYYEQAISARSEEFERSLRSPASPMSQGTSIMTHEQMSVEMAGEDGREADAGDEGRGVSSEDTVWVRGQEPGTSLGIPLAHMGWGRQAQIHAREEHHSAMELNMEGSYEGGSANDNVHVQSAEGEGGGDMELSQLDQQQQQQQQHPDLAKNSPPQSPDPTLTHAPRRPQRPRTPKTRRHHSGGPFSFDGDGRLVGPTHARARTRSRRTSIGEIREEGGEAAGQWGPPIDRPASERLWERRRTRARDRRVVEGGLHPYLLHWTSPIDLHDGVSRNSRRREVEGDV